MLGGSSHDLDTWLITMVIVSPLSGVVGPLPNGLLIAYGVTNYLLYNWDDVEGIGVIQL